MLDSKLIEKLAKLLAKWVGLPLFLFYAALPFFDWSLESSQVSPDERFTIYEYRYSGDSNSHAPYGTYLYLSKSKYNIWPRSGYIFFAGYCDKKIKYGWKNTEQIFVLCDEGEPEQIRTIAKTVYGIEIN